jgi:hypothetical protein
MNLSIPIEKAVQQKTEDIKEAENKEADTE